MGLPGHGQPATTPTYGSGASQRIHEALAHDTWREEQGKKRLNRLYADAWKTWAAGGRAEFERITPLLTLLRDRREELTEAEDASLREQYGLVAAVAL